MKVLKDDEILVFEHEYLYAVRQLTWYNNTKITSKWLTDKRFFIVIDTLYMYIK